MQPFDVSADVMSPVETDPDRNCDPLGATLAKIRGKEMNLILHDLARERNAALVDADAIAARLGAASHLRDAVHQSGTMQGELRNEIVHLLRDRGVRGFARLAQL